MKSLVAFLLSALLVCSSFVPILASMKEVKLFLIRHGETVANKNQILQGQSNDHPLTEEGEQQADTLGRLLRGRRWRRLYSSDLPRAISTAQRTLLASEHPFDEENTLTLTPHLREMCFGLREGHPRHVSSEEARRLRAEALGVAPHEIEDPAETIEQLIERQNAFLKQIVQDLLEDEREQRNELSHAPIFCMSHGGYILRFLRHVCKVECVEKIKNCAISIVHLKFNADGEYECVAREDALNLGTDVAHIPH